MSAKVPTLPPTDQVKPPPPPAPPRPRMQNVLELLARVGDSAKEFEEGMAALDRRFELIGQHMAEIGRELERLRRRVERLK